MTSVRKSWYASLAIPVAVALVSCSSNVSGRGSGAGGATTPGLHSGAGTSVQLSTPPTTATVQNQPTVLAPAFYDTLVKDEPDKSFGWFFRPGRYRRELTPEIWRKKIAAFAPYFQNGSAPQYVGKSDRSFDSVPDPAIDGLPLVTLNYRYKVGSTEYLLHVTMVKQGGVWWVETFGIGPM